MRHYSVHIMNALISKDNNEPEKGALTVSVSSSAGKESQLTLGLLQAIEQKDDISQRHLAQEMGVALGLANSYLKRCVKKGWIKMTTAPANRYLYYVTPNGFAEKARLTADFFTTSLALFKHHSTVFRMPVSKVSSGVHASSFSILVASIA